MEEFVDDDRGFFAWVARHPDGYVLNTQRNPRETYLMVHRATCGTLRLQYPRQKTMTGPYIKICGQSVEEIQQWADQHFRHRVTLQPCGKCKP